MRVRLNVPYEEKDIVKAMGARWDIKKKTWYINDTFDLHLFAKWLANLKLLKPKKPFKYREPKPRIKDPNEIRVLSYQTHGITKSNKMICDCVTPPWELCPHSKNAK
jgi:hypothetical protein